MIGWMDHGRRKRNRWNRSLQRMPPLCRRPIALGRARSRPLTPHPLPHPPRPKKSRLLKSLHCDFVRYNITIEIMTDRRGSSRALIPVGHAALHPPPSLAQREKIARSACSRASDENRAVLLVFLLPRNRIARTIAPSSCVPPPREDPMRSANLFRVPRTLAPYESARSRGRPIAHSLAWRFAFINSPENDPQNDRTSAHTITLTSYDYYQLDLPCITAACILSRVTFIPSR